MIRSDGVHVPYAVAIPRLLQSGEAQNIDEAEELFLNRSLPELYRLVGSDMTEEELDNHPLVQLLSIRGDRRLEGIEQWRQSIWATTPTPWPAR
jgi:hypothetical protein